MVRSGHISTKRAHAGPSVEYIFFRLDQFEIFVFVILRGMKTLVCYKCVQCE